MSISPAGLLRIERLSPLSPLRKHGSVTVMKHILFVEEDATARQGLRELVRPHRSEWDIVFVRDGEAGLTALAAISFDVVVVDADLPDMSGIAFLTRVKSDFPAVVRIILTGHVALQKQMSTFPVVHQSLLHDCEPAVFKETVDRVLRIQNLVTDKCLRNLVGEIDTLPSLPEIYLELTEILQQDASARKIAALVERDMAISAKILQLVNSAFFGAPKRITNIGEAVVYLGAALVKNLVFSLSIYSALSPNVHLPGFSLEKIERHGWMSAVVAENLWNEREGVDDAFMAAMLQDVGKLIFAKSLPERFGEAIRVSREKDVPLHHVEFAELGASHSGAGAYLLGIWGLPATVVEGVAYHHDVREVPHAEPGILDAVYISHALVQMNMADMRDPDDVSEVLLDEAYLMKMGVNHHVQDWQRLMGRSSAGEKMGSKGGKRG